MNRIQPLFAALTTCLGVAAFAAEAPDEEPSSDLVEIIVLAHPLSSEGLAQASDVLDADELERKAVDNIGATVGNEPGIHNSSYGAGAGRPVIHGLGGARVRIMEDQIDTLDVSVSSGDHAVTVDPFIAERVEILKGSTTLLYGSGAIGGVVDVHTGRIPHEVPERIEGAFDLRGSDNGNGRNGSLRLDGGGGNLAWHIDAFAREAGDYDIPGFAESAALRALEEEEAHHDEHEHGDDDHGDEEEHHEEEEGHGDSEATPIVDLEQTRIDLEAGIADPFGGFENLNFRLGINDYQHVENEAGEAGTAFANNAWEARAELTHAPVGGWSGALGVQLGDREFSVVGEEAFTPPVDTSSVGLFWVGERSLGELGLETGLRFDSVEHTPAQGLSRDFNGASASLGLIVPLLEGWQGTLLADYSSRAPVGEELFSDSPHPGTGVFEIGNPELDVEQARNLAATLSGGGDGWSLRGTFYNTNFADFIYQAATGEEQDGFAVYRYSQADATFAGFEVEGRVTVAEWDAGHLEIGAFFDMVSPELDVSGNDNLPLIPPERTGLSLEFTGDRLRATLEYVRASEQDDVADFELPTDSYDDLRARVAWRFRPGDMEVDLFLAGRNLTDSEQRLHTSVVKDLAPQPGRTIEAGLRMRF